MNDVEIEELIAKGLTALDNDHTHLALVCFERVIEVDRSPLVCSSLGYCLAVARGEIDQGIALCEEAVKREPTVTAHYLSLGRIISLSGRSKEAIDVFREGLRCGRDDRIIAELDRLGTRKSPLIHSLSRHNLLNRALGLILARLGFR